MSGLFDDSDRGEESPPRMTWGDEPRPGSLWGDDQADDLKRARAHEFRVSKKVAHGRGFIVGGILTAGLVLAGAVWLARGADEENSITSAPFTPPQPGVSATSGAESEADRTLKDHPRSAEPTREGSAPNIESPADGTTRAAEADDELSLPVAARGNGWDPLEALAELTDIQGHAGALEMPYDREAFGQAWFDVDRNGCDTRNDILRRDLEGLRIKENTHGCVALAGTLSDPYTGERFDFLRGSGNAGELHVDHVVALSEAWHKGANRWEPGRREAFANDPDNLVVTLGRVNMEKSDKDAAAWLPPDPRMHCGFALQVILVKDEYDLAIGAGERQALQGALSTCASDSPLLVSLNAGS